MENWTEKVRKSTLFVVQNANHVKINTQKLHELASLIPERLPKAEPNDLIPKENVRDWVLLISLINFSFWPDEGKKFEVVHDNKPYRGYWAMCAIVKRLIDSGKLITNPHEWPDKRKLKEWFLGKTDYIPMLDERVEVLNKAYVALVQINFDIDSLLCNDVNATLNNLLSSFLSLRYNALLTLRDWCQYKGERIYFLKRAQIMLADWYTALGPENIPSWNMNKLTMFADYRIPAILHDKGKTKH